MDDDRRDDTMNDPLADTGGANDGARGSDDSGGAEDTPGVGVDPALLDSLAGQLVWRIGRAAEDAPVTVRVGLASAASAFAELPRLRNATDTELRDAIEANEVRIEWVGTKGR